MRGLFKRFADPNRRDTFGGFDSREIKQRSHRWPNPEKHLSPALVRDTKIFATTLTAVDIAHVDETARMVGVQVYGRARREITHIQVAAPGTLARRSRA